MTLGRGRWPASRLPDLAEQLAAHLALARLPVGQQPQRRRDDPHPEAVAHRLDLRRPLVDPASRAAHPRHVADRRRALRAVAQEDADRAVQLSLAGLDLPQVLDEALLLEQADDLHLY